MIVKDAVRVDFGVGEAVGGRVAVGGTGVEVGFGVAAAVSVGAGGVAGDAQAASNTAIVNRRVSCFFMSHSSLLIVIVSSTLFVANQYHASQG
jgi:hypothetical protein